MKYEFHQYANLFPLMAEEDRQRLADDIKNNSQREPIWLFEGKILDGRNRYLACLDVGETPIFEQFEGSESEALSAVISWNLERRHLTSSQCLAVSIEANELAESIAAEAKKRQIESGGDRKSESYKESVVEFFPQPINQEDSKTRSKIAKLFRTNPRYVSDGKRINASAPELFEPIKQGKITVPDAVRISKMDESDRAEVLQRVDDGAKPKDAIRDHKREVRAKAVEATSAALSSSGEAKEVKLGDSWALGNHRLYCMDSADWDFNGSAKMAFADPPYNVGVDKWDSGFVWLHDWLEEVADFVFVTPGTSQIGPFAKVTEMQYRWLLTCGLPGVYGRHSAIGTSNTIQILLFSKLASVHIGASDYMTCSYDQTERFESTHRGRKPSALMAWLIDAFSDKGDVVLDPFLGSGTTLLMAESLGRICYGCELVPAHCESIIARWEAMTGQQAQLLRSAQLPTPPGEIIATTIGSAHCGDLLPID